MQIILRLMLMKLIASVKYEPAPEVFAEVNLSNAVPIVNPLSTPDVSSTRMKRHSLEYLSTLYGCFWVVMSGKLAPIYMKYFIWMKVANGHDGWITSVWSRI